MQFGLCVSAIDQARDARSWGYDYVEIFSGLLRPLEPDSVWPERRRELEDTEANMSNLAAFMGVTTFCTAPTGGPGSRELVRIWCRHQTGRSGVCGPNGRRWFA